MPAAGASLIGKGKAIITAAPTGAGLAPEEIGIAPVAWRPEMAALAMGLLDFGDEVFFHLPPDIEAFARAIETAGIAGVDPQRL